MEISEEIGAESAPLRRPQQARSRATRRKILAAAVETLVDRGYAGASTTEIGRRAGVSQGALFKHFDSKLSLLGAAIDHLFQEMIASYERAFETVAAERPDRRLSAALDLLRATFAEPRLQAAFELYVAARTDASLREAIEPAMRAHRQNLKTVAHALFPEEAARTPTFEAAVDLILDTLQGAALGALVLPDPDSDAPVFALLERWVDGELSAFHGDE